MSLRHKYAAQAQRFARFSRASGSSLKSRDDSASPAQAGQTRVEMIFGADVSHSETASSPPITSDITGDNVAASIARRDYRSLPQAISFPATPIFDGRRASTRGEKRFASHRSSVEHFYRIDSASLIEPCRATSDGFGTASRDG
ncbi:hypothetical protein GRJ2_001416100 [Grus japonensis]|uniref:Uncharacterized protein n=1 Tax=Grus japonensis TaxID=30415 RepID=A0ABC9WVN1_GRUJA